MGPFGALLDRLGLGGGDVLELACGTGVWTELLAARCRSVLALDGAPEMLAAARERIGPMPGISFDQADLLAPAWVPPGRFDTVFFGFWLSHVPMDRFDRFWTAVRAGLVEGGRVVFVDGAGTARRTRPDGSTARIVKVLHEPTTLAARLDQQGWDADVQPWGRWFLTGVAQPR